MRSTTSIWNGRAAALAAWALLAAAPAFAQSPDLRVAPRPLPEFADTAPAAWINSAPLSVAGLRGQVVLIEVWTTA